MAKTLPADVIGKLREAVAGSKSSPIFKNIMEPRDTVLARFQPVFSPDHVKEITAEEFRSFLLLENNHHWSGLHRQGPRMCADMDKLRDALSMLLDEDQPVADRLDKATDMVSGMGKNIASAILLVTHPDRCGVWNNRSEAQMKRLRIWPHFERGESFGNRYVKVNQILLHLRDALKIDLWMLDALWWYLDQKESGDLPTTEVGETLPGGVSVGSEQRFGLERHLHEFLRDNWNQIELGREWAIYQEPGDEEAGYEYSCELGRIDLLAEHRKEPRWLVIELKRNQTSDQTVGQLLRYIGWVKRYKAKDGEQVHGMIICREADDALRYALSTVQNVELRLYQVEFHLGEPETLLATSGEDGEGEGRHIRCGSPHHLSPISHHNSSFTISKSTESHFAVRMFCRRSRPLSIWAMLVAKERRTLESAPKGPPGTRATLASSRTILANSSELVHSLPASGLP